MEKCRSPRAALVVPVDLTLPPSPVGDARGEDFLAFLELRAFEEALGGEAVAVVLVEGEDVEAAEEGVRADTTSTEAVAGDETAVASFEEPEDKEAAARLLLLLPRLSSAALLVLLLLGMGWWCREGWACAAGGAGCPMW